MNEGTFAGVRDRGRGPWLRDFNPRMVPSGGMTTPFASASPWTRPRCISHVRMLSLAPMIGLAMLVGPVFHVNASSPPPPTTVERPVDIAPIASHLVFVEDGKGHALALVPRNLRRKLPKGWPRSYVLFWSANGSTFHALHTSFSARDRSRYVYDFHDPRHPENRQRNQRSRLETLDGGATFALRCDERQTVFRPVAADPARKRLKSSRWMHPLWNRTVVVLARDDRGAYTLVDNAMWPADAQDYRVYRGMRGDLKALRLKSVADDDAGKVFATRSGRLRLIVGRDASAPARNMSAEWIKGRVRTQLIVLDKAVNQRLIYSELGPYLGMRLGTPCDVL